jgi:hypothetical protein
MKAEWEEDETGYEEKRCDSHTKMKRTGIWREWMTQQISEQQKLEGRWGPGDLRFSRLWLWRVLASEMWRRVVW